MAPTAVPYPTKTAKYPMARSRHLTNRYYCYYLLVFPFFDKNPIQEKAKYSQLSVRDKQESKFKNFCLSSMILNLPKSKALSNIVAMLILQDCDKAFLL